MGKYNEIKSNLNIKKEIQNIHCMGNKRKENTRETKIMQMKEKFNLKKKNEKISNEKSWRREILYKFKKFYEFLRFIISFINFFSLFVKLNQKKILFKLSEITLKVKGVGNIKILSDSFFQRYNQCEIYINGILQNITNNEYYLNYIETTALNISKNESESKVTNEYIKYSNNTEKINVNSSKNKSDLKEPDLYIIKIIWNDIITSTDFMFSNCDKIIEIDLSNFNATKVNNMSNMFYGCTSLKSLNFSHFDTSNVINTESMFYKCSNLSSLDIYNFDTSHISVMTNMFSQCLSLISLNLSNFDTRNVSNMNNN